MKTRVAGYIRVSSDEQVDGYSLSAQEKAIQDFASLRGWQAINIYREEGKSAKSDQRPVFQQMIDDAKLGHFDVIAVHKLDRFSRSLIDVMTYLNDLNQHGVSFVSVTEDFDFSTPIGKVILAMLAAFAQWYLDNLSNEVSKGKKERARKGGWNGTLSYGYTTPQRLRDKLNSKPSPDDAKLIESTLDQYPDAGDTDAVPCPFDAPAVKLAYEMYATGRYSARKIADKLNREGYRISTRNKDSPLSTDTVGKMLKNRFYIGETSYGAKVEGKERHWMPGGHAAIISHDLFEQVTIIRDKRNKKFNTSPHNKKRCYPLTSLLISVENGIRWKGNVTRNQRKYRRPKTDTLPGRVVAATQLENKIGEFLQDISLVPEWEIHIQANHPVKQSSDEINKMKRQLERLKKLFLYGDIEEDFYLRESNKLKQEINRAESFDSIEVDKVIELGHIVENVYEIWSIATLKEKEGLAKQLFEKIYLKDRTIVAIEPTAILWQLLRHGVPVGEDRIRTCGTRKGTTA
jgi:site-specific DNA recombinase